MTYEVVVSGMSCGHCVSAVRDALSGVEGLDVEAVEVGRAFVSADDIDRLRDEIEDAVDEEGFQVEEIAERPE